MARLDIEIDASGARSGSAQAVTAINQVGHTAKKVKSSLDALKQSFFIATGLAVFTAAMVKATKVSIEFASAIAEVDTLLGDIPEELALITEEAKKQAIAFGSLPVQQAKAFYQIISAGANSAANATETLTASNKLAVGGVTDVLTAADGLTSVLNAYGSNVESATAVSDAMFVAMRAGKTNIAQLSSELGQVAPIASTVGVSFDQLLASIAAITKGGVTTSIAVTQVRSILTALIRPEKQASLLAQKLGIEFNIAGLRAKGFAGFIEDVRVKTGASEEVMAKLFGRVEAVSGVFALTGNAAKSFSDILDQMLNKTGETDRAFDKISQNDPFFQVKRAGALLTVVLIEIGDVISSVFIPALQLLVDNFETLKKIIAITGIALAIAFGPQIIALIGTGLVAALGLATTAMKVLALAVASTGLGAIAVVLGTAVGAIALFGDEITIIEGKTATLKDALITIWEPVSEAFMGAVNFWIELWDKAAKFLGSLFFDIADDSRSGLTLVLEGTKTAINTLIGIWVGTYKSIIAVWGLLPSAFKDLGIQAINALISATEFGINAIIRGFAALPDETKKIFQKVGTFISNTFDNLITALGELPEDFARLFTKAFDKISSIAVKGVNFIIEKFNSIPGINIDPLMDKLSSDISEGGESIADKFKKALAKISTINDAGLFQVELGRVKNDAEGTADKVGSILKGIFKDSLDTDFIQGAIDKFIKELEATSKKRHPVVVVNGEQGAVNQANSSDSSQGQGVSQRLLSIEAVKKGINEEIGLLRLVGEERTRAAALLSIENSLRSEGVTLTQDEKVELESLIAVKRELEEPTTFFSGFDQRMAEMVDSSRTAAAQMGEALATVFGPGGSLSTGIANSIAQAVVFGRSFEDSLKNIGRQIAAQLLSKLIQTGLQMAIVAIAGQAMATNTTAAITAQNATLTAEGIASQASLATAAVLAAGVIETAYTPAAISASIATAGGAATLGAAAFTTAYTAMLATTKSGAAVAAFADGGAFTNSVVKKPTQFNLGEMGERGPEAIMPLTRTSSGALGVRAIGGSQGTAINTFSPTIMVTVENTGGDPGEAGAQIAEQIQSGMEVAMGDFIRKQQKSGGQLNRQRSL